MNMSINFRAVRKNYAKLYQPEFDKNLNLYKSNVDYFTNSNGNPRQAMLREYSVPHDNKR